MSPGQGLAWHGRSVLPYGRYIPDVARSLHGMLTMMSDPSLDLMPEAGSRKREFEDLLEEVRTKRLKQESLEEKYSQT